MKSIPSGQKSSIYRHLAAAFYDGLCLFSLFFLATMSLVVFSNGESIDSNNLIYDLYLFLITYFYFAWHWVNGGQTLGMRAWHIKVTARAGNLLNWKLASRRFCLALISVLSLGLGFIWAVFDKDKLTFHDRYAKTQVIHDP